MAIVTFTRVYFDNPTGTVKKHNIDIDTASIESVRGRNKFEGSHSCIISKSGKYYNLAETKQQVQEKLAAVGVAVVA